MPTPCMLWNFGMETRRDGNCAGWSIAACKRIINTISGINISGAHWTMHWLRSFLEMTNCSGTQKTLRTRSYKLPKQLDQNCHPPPPATTSRTNCKQPSKAHRPPLAFPGARLMRSEIAKIWDLCVGGIRRKPNWVMAPDLALIPAGYAPPGAAGREGSASQSTARSTDEKRRHVTRIGRALRSRRNPGSREERFNIERAVPGPWTGITLRI